MPDTPATGDTGDTVNTPAVSGEVLPLTGPPAKWSDHDWPTDWQGPFLDSLATLPVVSSAARAAGVSRAWAYRVRIAQPVFADAWDDAIVQGVELIEQNVVKWATVGIQKRVTTTKRNAQGEVLEETTVTSMEASASLAMFVLKRHKPEYRERYGIEHTGADGGPITMTIQEKLDEAAERFDASVVRLALASGSG